MDEVAPRLAAIEAVLANADVALSTDLGGYAQTTSARAWRGQVLVDWEPDPAAGDCLLRADLLRRLIALHAQVQVFDDRLEVTAPGRIVASLSAEHADLVKRLGGARRLELRMTLRFAGAVYVGGEETYYLIEQRQPQRLMHLTARVTAREGSPRTSPAPS